MHTQRTMLNYFGFWLVFSATLLLSSCGLRGKSGGGDPPSQTPTGNTGNAIPVMMTLTIAPVINAGECQVVTITSADLNGTPAKVTQNVLVTLLSLPGGKFYLDGKCVSQISSIQIPFDQTAAKPYFRSTVAGKITIVANAAPFFLLPSTTNVQVLPNTSLAISESPAFFFGPHYLLTQTDKTFTVTNTGLSQITNLNGNTFAGNSPFSFKGGSFPGIGGTCSSTLAAEGSSCTFIVRFVPSLVTAYADSIVLTFSDTISSQSSSRAITGSGVLSGSLGFQNTYAIGLSDDRGLAITKTLSNHLLIAGYSAQTETQNDFAIIKTNTSGLLDSSFGTSGKQLIPMSTEDDRALAIKEDSDGSVFVGGYAQTSGTYKFAIAKITSTGTLDISFGSAGKTIIAIGSQNAYCTSLSIQPNGKILLAGYYQADSSNHIALVRLNSNGNLDTSFGNDGIKTLSLGSSSYAQAIHAVSNNQIYIAGYTNQSTTNFFLVRLGVGGDLDTAFGGSGLLTIDMNSGQDYAHSMALDSSGNIYLAGTSHFSGVNHFAIAKVLSSGSLDTSFNDGGTKILSVANQFDEAHAIAVASNGKLVVSGYAYNGNDYDVAVARLWPDGSLDTSFTGSGFTTLGFSGHNDRAFGVAVLSDGTVIAAGDTRGSGDFDYLLLSLLP